MNNLLKDTTTSTDNKKSDGMNIKVSSVDCSERKFHVLHPKLLMLEILAYGSQKIKGEKKEALEFSKSLTKHWLQDISLSHVQCTFRNLK